MDEKKIINLKIKQNKETEEVSLNKKQGFLHTNPILKQMFAANVFSGKKKFSLKDLFR